MITETLEKPELQAMHEIASKLQALLDKLGNGVIDGAKPSIVLYPANPKPGAPAGEPNHWCAGIVFHQHLADRPLHALQALGQTLLSSSSVANLVAPTPPTEG